MTGLNKKILIIDPNHDERTVMASYLKDENYDVEIGEGLTDISNACLWMSNYRK